MTFKELIDKFTWEELIPAFQHLYPDDKLEGYEVAFAEIKSLTPEPSNMEIDLEYVLDEDGNYVDVYGMDMEDGQRYALDLTPWTEWLFMPISKYALAAYESKALLVHCLWEMTFYAYSNEEILAKRKELFDTVEKIENGELGIGDEDA